MIDSTRSNASPTERLCLECGLCCNGVIFADVQLQPKDDPQQLRSLGLPILPSGRRNLKFVQPCAALEGCRCRIYADRPRYCREFECILLKNVMASRLSPDAALATIRTAREKADVVRSLLHRLGDTDEQLDLAARFRRMTKKFESEELADETADIYGELTLAVHDLNSLLSESFYR